MSLFKKATREKTKLRLALAGPSGSGKTYTALTVGREFGKIAYIDTEHRSASRYAGEVADFDVLEFEPPFHPDRLIKYINAAESEGYDVVIVDSLSHFWTGKGGILEIVDEVAAKNRARGNPNAFTAWKDGTAIFNEMVEKIIRCKIHIICCMRSKSEYLQTEDDKGRKKIEKVGTAPIQRDGLEYEFDLVLDLDVHHTAVISKSRVLPPLPEVMRCPGESVAKHLLEWCTAGADPAERLAREQAAEAKRLAEEAKRLAETEELAKSKGLKAVQAKAKEHGFDTSDKTGDFYTWLGLLEDVGTKGGRPSLSACSVDQLRAIYAGIPGAKKALEDAAPCVLLESTHPEPKPLSSATIQAATANGVHPLPDDSPHRKQADLAQMAADAYVDKLTEWAKLDRQEFDRRLRQSVKEQDIRLNAVLADAKIDHNGQAVRFQFPAGYDWASGKVQEGSPLIQKITGMDVIVQINEKQKVEA